MKLRKGTRTGIGKSLAKVLAMLLLAPIAAAAIFQANMSSLIDPSSPELGRFLTGPHAPLAGGVVPSGHVDFKLDGKHVEPKDLHLRFSRADGSVHLMRDKVAYRMTIDPGLTCPLAQFVARHGVIAFTIPVAARNEDPAQYEEFGLMKVDGPDYAYVAKEFRKHAKFLEAVDIDTTSEPLDESIVARIKAVAHRGRLPAQLVLAEMGTLVNADFNVRYEARLAGSQRPVVDIGGVPLVYYWDYARDGKPMLDSIDVFEYPSKEQGLQYEAVLFFQNAAVFRELRDANSTAFQSFVKDACAG